MVCEVGWPRPSALIGCSWCHEDRWVLMTPPPEMVPIIHVTLNKNATEDPRRDSLMEVVMRTCWDTGPGSLELFHLDLGQLQVVVDADGLDGAQV